MTSFQSTVHFQRDMRHKINLLTTRYLQLEIRLPWAVIDGRAVAATRIEIGS
jgi:hypothetical protein